MSSEAPRVLPGNDDHEKLQELSKLTYKQQGVWFLNAFWEQHEGEGETIWKYVHTCSDLDLQDHEEGCGLDEVNAHRFLEVYGETLTVRELRAKLRSTGALEESERPKIVPLTHFLLFKYGVDWHKLVNASQGDNSEEIKKAQAMLEEVQAAFRESDEKHRQAAASLRAAEQAAKEAADREADAKSTQAAAQASADAAKAKENDAKEKEAEAVKQEAPFKAAQEEVEAALAEVKSQEDAYNSRTEELKQKSETGGVVSRNKAANELAQHLAEDPLPLRKAKITLEAARKRAEKTRAPFEAATKEAEAARQIADKALADARAKVQEAENYLNEVKSRPGQPYGALWWIDRELHEAKAYVPESKGGYRKK